MKHHSLSRRWKIFLIHHTHLDIGYTHTQKEVLLRQFEHLERAMRLVDENKTRPFASRFRWNPEATWALEEWFFQVDEDKRKKFIKMVKEGYIGLDALYGNLLTGLCRPDELMENFSNQKRFQEITGVKIDSAMISDVPGWNWGIVTGLQENGVRYLSAGTNVFDRIGYILKDWGDKPFYWMSPSGKEKILLFVHGKGYSWFHSVFSKEHPKNKLKPRRIARYLRKLEACNYPYNTVILRYNIGTDNGPPDDRLCEIAQQWNSENPNMQLIISTTSQAMSDFENDYGDLLPVFSGDLTPYWEDGALSTSRETAINREASERLTQAKTLTAMIDSGSYNSRSFRQAWNNVLLFNEHTWGAYNSISRPNSAFVKKQWNWKKQRALDAARLSKELLENATSGNLHAPAYYEDRIAHSFSSAEQKRITVYNSQSWPVTQIVRVMAHGDLVTDDQGMPVWSQRLHDGSLAFCAAGILPTSSKRYKISEGRSHSPQNPCVADGVIMCNDRVRLTIDQKHGGIKSITYANKELVKQTDMECFNNYVFVTSKFASIGKKVNTHGKIEISVLDRGPLVSTIRIRKRAYKTKSITTDISIDALSEKIYIRNLIDRPVTRKKEGVYFEFPYNYPDGRIKYDTLWGSVEVDQDQLPGANRNFFTATRWFDIGDFQTGVSCALLDAPIFKSGQLINDPFRIGPPKLCGWIRETEYNGTVYSYVMNNYWQTNYKADQPGLSLFRYVFLPHGQFVEHETQCFAIEQAQPLIAVADGKQSGQSLLSVADRRIISTSVTPDVDGLFVRFYNVSEDEVETLVSFKKKVRLIVKSSGKESCLNGNRIRLAPKETINVQAVSDE